MEIIGKVIFRDLKQSPQREYREIINTVSPVVEGPSSDPEVSLYTVVRLLILGQIPDRLLKGCNPHSIPHTAQCQNSIRLCQTDTSLHAGTPTYMHSRYYT